MKYYTIYEPETGKVTNGVYSETKPENSVEAKITDKMIKPFYDFNTNSFYDAATAEDLEEYNIDLWRGIKELTDQSLTNEQTSAELNSKYPYACENFLLITPNINSVLSYRKINNTQWRQDAAGMV